MASGSPNITPRQYKTSELKSRILNVAQTSVNQVKLQPPSTVLGFLKESGREFIYEQQGENLELLCEAAVLPGSALATHDVTNDYAGVSEKMAYRRMYDGTMDLTFLVDKNYNVIEFFEGWIDYISGIGLTQNRDQYKSRYANMRMSYPMSYRTEVFLSKFEKDISPGNRGTRQSPRIVYEQPKQLDYTFVGAFPESFTSMPVSYGPSDALRCNVTFSYIRYVRNRKGVRNF